MKKKLTKAAWEKLPEAVQALYEKTGDTYTIMEDYASLVTGDDDDDDDDPEGGDNALLRAKQHEKRRRQEAERKLKEAQDRLREIDEASDADKRKKLKENGDVEALERSWEKKLQDARTQADQEKARLQTALEEATCGEAAQRMASEISTIPELMAPEIRKRLKAEIQDSGKVIVRVLDADGQPSADSLSDLQKEIASQKKWKAVIKGHSASGGGADGGGASEGGSFKLSDYQVKGGGVNWTKVAEAEKETPGTLEKVKAALAEQS